MLIISSLMSILLFEFHMTSDIMYGIEEGVRQDLVGATVICLVWLSGTLLLSERRSGYIITLLGGILAVGVPYLHMGGAGVGGEFAQTRSAAFFFIWTLFMLALTGAFSVMLSVRGLWRRELAKPR
jgi:hypothetical protein